MSRINRVASSYAARGHTVKVLSARRIAVTDAVAGNAYRVSAYGRAIVGKELAAELAAEAAEEPEAARPGCARQLAYLD